MRRIIATALLVAAAPPLHAQVGCTLTLGVPGRLTMSGDGTTLGSENTLGLSTSVTVSGVTSPPRVTFASHAVTGPAGWSASPVTSISVVSAGGASRPYTSAGFSVRSSISPDLFVINSKVVSASGFKAGSYDVSTQVTCQAS